MDSHGRHVVVVGPMGVGKTSVGRELARLLDLPFLDSDAEIEQSMNETAAGIATDRGVAALHAVELEVFGDMVASPPPAVIAPAASVADSDEGRELMARCLIVVLTASPDVLARRMGGGEHRRPVSMAQLEALMKRRVTPMREVAIVTVDTSALSVPDAARQIARSLNTA